ncbi:MAG: T9SS type A sorting domain-containing protein [Salinivirgaceae bacterium]|nr:T9SS type A sorting domain-containing protein [Salinivirgaceae bacterium]
MKRIILALGSLMLFCIETVNAQTTVATAGGEAGTVSFTVGQPFVEVSRSDAGSITPGVQQAYAISIIDGIDNKQISLEAEVYPNPVVDRLTLRVADADMAALRYTLTDNNGRTLETADIAEVQTSIDMARYVQGVYFLCVDDGNALVKTFKIVKN